MHRFPLAALLLVLALPLPSRAVPPTDCATPRHAVESLFGWMRGPERSLDRAVRCLDGEGRSAEELRIVAQRIESVYANRGIEIAFDRLPDVADHVDARSRLPRVVVDDRIPELYVERQEDGQWRWPRTAIEKLDVLQREALDGGIRRLVARFPRWLRGDVFGVEIWQYLALALLALLGLVLRKIIQVVVASRVARLTERFGQLWATRLVAALDSPGATLVMAGVLALTWPQLQLPIRAALAMQVAVRLIAAIAVVWAAYRLVDVLSAAMAHRAARTESKLDDQLVPLVRRSLKVATVVIGALFVLQNLEVDVGSLLAGLGIGGLAFALAAKDTLANFFGSVVIFADRPFQIGDWVVLADGTEGIVEEVGFRSTRIRTFYNSLVTVPNAKIADSKVDNYGARIYRRTYTTLHLARDTTPEQVQAFVEGVRAIIRAHPNTRKDYYEIHLSGIGEWSLQVMLYFFFRVPNWSLELRGRHEVYLEILRLAQELGVRFAFPTSTMLHEYVAEPGQPRAQPTAPRVEDLAAVVHAHGPGGERSRPGGNEIAGGWFAGQDPVAAQPGRKSA